MSNKEQAFRMNALDIKEFEEAFSFNGHESLMKQLSVRISMEVDNQIAGFIEKITESYPWSCKFVFNAENITNALRKQVSMKPSEINVQIYVDERHARGKCPVCGRIMGSTFNYCNNCGQALDWSDV